MSTALATPAAPADSGPQAGALLPTAGAIRVGDQVCGLGAERFPASRAVAAVHVLVPGLRAVVLFDDGSQQEVAADDRLDLAPPF